MIPPRIHSYAIAAFIFFLPVTLCCGRSLALDQTAAKPSATELSQLIGKAYGGFAKIKEANALGTRNHCKSSAISGISEATNAFECEIIGKGDSLRLETVILGQKNILGFDGKEGWTQVGNWVAPSTDTSVQRMKDELDHGLNALEELDKPDVKLESVASKLVQGKTCPGFKLIPANGKWTIFYADPQSHLVLRTEFMGHDSEQGFAVKQAFEFSDYKAVEGMPTPYRIVEFAGERKKAETTIESIVVDSNISDDLFKMPAESKTGSLDNNPITIPFQYVGNEIIINASINNGPEGKFIVDTGASQTVIDKKCADQIGPYTVSTFNVTTGAKAVPLSYIKMHKINIGSVTVEDCSALVSDLSSFAGAIGQRPAGLIGANILRRFLVAIDYPERKLILANPQSVNVPANAIIIPTSPAFGASALVVSGILNDKHQVNFLVDTGAAFNNLPQTIAAKLGLPKTLAVGQIYGLDGQKLNIGSIKLNKLKLGSYEIKDPVFALHSEPSTAGGLFRAGSMGILGNPVWSKTKLTVDYRNERLILEAPAGMVESERLIAEIRDTERVLLKNKNVEEASRNYARLEKSAHEQGLKAAEALAISGLASCSSKKFLTSKDNQWLAQATTEYDRASKLAVESGDKNVEGEILGQWALLCISAPRSNSDLMQGQALLQKSLAKAPTVANTYAVLGGLMLKANKQAMAKQFIDQALMLDPANWQALWARYQMAETKPEEQKLILSQLGHYYPDFAEVKDKLGKTMKPANTSVKKIPARKK
ncbi:MAG: retroviral-like aspartic protease family protein [Candidatus Obscuribacterales bacterium]|nr:retroviral-like aspartic protease family protein [Candidatus Obscuribacterales bacterium]